MPTFGSSCLFVTNRRVLPLIYDVFDKKKTKRAKYKRCKWNGPLPLYMLNFFIWCIRSFTVWPPLNSPTSSLVFNLAIQDHSQFSRHVIMLSYPRLAYSVLQSLLLGAPLFTLWYITWNCTSFRSLPSALREVKCSPLCSPSFCTSPVKAPATQHCHPLSVHLHP